METACDGEYDVMLTVSETASLCSMSELAVLSRIHLLRGALQDSDGIWRIPVLTARWLAEASRLPTG